LKATQVISGEIKVERLLEKLLRILIENAGAERGVVLLTNDANELQIVAEVLIEGSETIINIFETWQSTEIGLVPRSIIRFVERQKENIVIADATKDKFFQKSTYLQTKRIKSLLCTPIIQQNNLKGLIYLENNLTSHVFTNERVELINVLAAQIAVSLENALLYENMEQKVNQRTQELNLKNEELNERNKELDKKNQSILDSVRYAQTIQSATLPLENAIHQCFEEHFILYKPRDIVSGDFYWLHSVSPQHIIFTVADCTGHGVPGAFMSMIGNTLLNQIVVYKQIYNPADILNELHNEVRKILKQSENEHVRDGMDIAICSIFKDTKKMYYAGAMNPIYIVQNNQLIEYKATKRPVGGKIYKENLPFIVQEIDISEPTMVYMFSDGFQDQFGGLEGRKFMTKNFRDLLHKIHHHTPQEQKLLLEQTFTNWIGTEYSQIDDVLIAGIKLT
jgi:serine phosphatase RsbU (regulator of sigma subunit)